MLQPPRPTTVALLSAASVTEGGTDSNIALAVVGGDPLLAHQITALRHVGIKAFLIEVDHVPGALLTLADKVRRDGCSVEFVRSVDDLKKQIRTSQLLLIQAEGLFAAPEFLASVLEGPDPFVATVDGRDENEPFERMDLNTRWAGLAVLNAATVASLEPLPDGWSISSSLLRQAMRDAVPNRLIKQSNIQHGFLLKISSADDTEQLTRRILANRAGRERGFIESRLFGPIVTRIAPLIWRSPSGGVLLDGFMLGASAASFALAAFNWHIAAICGAFLAVFLNSVRQAASSSGFEQGLARWITPLMWTLLAGAVVWGARATSLETFDGFFTAGTLIGLTILARHLKLPVWAERLLRSPALIAGLMLVLTPWVGFATAAKCVSLGQLLLLIVAKWTHLPKT
ncbi:MAG: hypothetical protein ABI668_03540 [Sphingorhabdus sp.]